ncbi:MULTISPECIES: DUF4387 family protein [Francisella]|uniref:DUF4387 domain-containing protein n=1 Tax=Francisella opportunistica TaxID=2016517 RepID=A0A345JPF1_9GAMM|nr:MULTISPECIES: DUF4387 family protein [Francisella]APC90865.1 hypothetical protein BBG19_0127 [Francisella sp. MA067296]AXH29197.1 DUF4387 domain-containing protein [Francisella opportunistica]AXH30848.1 DUF4387 domain-containing protein [Francisella opportunistica]AXH32493.1 DUF4387 domain-containing protein [Francisella opportunistica]
MTYRILSVCAGLGYGFDQKSIENASKLKLDIVASDAGSMDPGPYYLGKGAPYFKKAVLKRDFSLMLDVALKQKCPLLLGSCGLAGDDPHLEFMLEIAKEVFIEKNIPTTKVAVISGHVDNTLLFGEISNLTPLGKMPPLTLDSLKKSVIVAQMGIAPFITALDEGAQIIFCGRACDMAIFAADAIRQGIDPGLAFHAAHILECGAIACEPGSASDSLIAEFDENSVVFIAPNKNRRTTIQSIAAHSLYEESHPSLQFYPEGVLTVKDSYYFQKNSTIAGIKNSKFVHLPLTIKLEGSEWKGKRIISLLPCIKKESDKIPGSYIVYGKNGVEPYALLPDQKEVSILIKVTSSQKEISATVAGILKGYMLHFGYPGRRSTSGNIAFPTSPSEITFQSIEGLAQSVVIAGTRDPIFIENFKAIKSSVIDLAKSNFSELYNQCQIEVSLSDHPLLFLETIAETQEEALLLHKLEISKLDAFIEKDGEKVVDCILAEDLYEWSIFHILHNENLIKEKLFPIKIYECSGSQWNFLREIKTKYKKIGLENYTGSIDEKTLNAIKHIEHIGPPIYYKKLTEMSTIIRSKNAGVNIVTIDIFFKTKKDYEIAVNSNVFTKENIAAHLQISENNIVGCYYADSCDAIKISRYREAISGVPSGRDVFGSQQQMQIEMLEIPIYDTGKTN